MGKFGLLLIGLGIGLWYWAGGELEKLGEYPRDLGVVEAFQEYPAARMDTLRYVGGAAAVLGVLIAIMPTGRRL